MPTILYRTRAAARPLVRAGQPVAQLPGGFVGRTAVKGHQGSRHTWDSRDAGAPAILRNGRYLDQVRAPADAFFIAMDDCAHVSVLQRENLGVPRIVRRDAPRSSEAMDEDLSTSAHPAIFGRRNVEINFACRSLNRKFTDRPQLLHTAFRALFTTPLRARPQGFQLDGPGSADYAWNFMKTFTLAGLITVAGLLAASRSIAADNATLFRVFLKDGT